jgi:2-dehydro-3-deoxyphosphogluconate aldolase/(4S)-4-hydroxy-2-oxoglutarate aldolase
MDRRELLGELHGNRLVAVIRSKTPELALETAQAAANAGLKFVEITYSVPGAVEVIKNLTQGTDLHVGAGTVLSKQQADEAIKGGAQFVVAPSLELELIPLCHEANVACFPGAATPTEILAAMRAGADLVKIFPADLAGGPYFIRQMQGPFPEARFMVSGGVSLANIQEYVQVGATGICLGSAYLGTLLAEKGHAGFVKEITEFRKLVIEAQNFGKIG